LSALAALAALTTACGSSPQTRQLRAAVRETVAQPGAATASVAFRFGAQRAADVRLYSLPDLEEVAWRFETPDLVAEELIGFASDDDLVYVLAPGNRLMALDLNTGRTRLADSGVVAAALGPTGTPVYAREDDALVALPSRRPEIWLAGFSEPVARLAGTARRDLLIVGGEDGMRELITVAGRGGEVRRQPLPDGRTALSPWSDAVAVAADSGVVVADPLRQSDDAFARIDPAPRDLAFSPSGHRIWVSTAAGQLLELERFSLDVLRRVRLDSGVSAVRADPLGRVMLVRTEADSLWVVPAARDTAPTRIAGGWQADLPAVASDGTLLVRQGNDVVALDLATLTERGRVPAGAADRWMTVPWDPRRPALQLAGRPDRQTETAPGQRIYVQVSSTTNPTWAEDLARDLRNAGLRASVLPPEGLEEMFRVVVGPYANRDQAEAAGRQLGMPFWIFTQNPSAAAPGEP
jgi:hypothetical protein